MEAHNPDRVRQGFRADMSMENLIKLAGELMELAGVQEEDWKEHVLESKRGDGDTRYLAYFKISLHLHLHLYLHLLMHLQLHMNLHLHLPESVPAPETAPAPAPAHAHVPKPASAFGSMHLQVWHQALSNVHSNGLNPAICCSPHLPPPGFWLLRDPYHQVLLREINSKWRALKLMFNL